MQDHADLGEEADIGREERRVKIDTFPREAARERGRQKSLYRDITRHNDNRSDIEKGKERIS